MDRQQELYYDEINNLKKFRSRLNNYTIYKEEIDGFADEYEELVSQAKVITRVSDRLQKKLDSANIQIREQNDEIKDKNFQLESTVNQLAKARVGRLAATILFILFIVLVMIEEQFLEPYVTGLLQENDIRIPYLNLALILLVAIFLKIFESALQAYFMNREKKKILKGEVALSNPPS